MLSYPQDVRIDRPGRVFAALTATFALVAVMLPGVPALAGAEDSTGTVELTVLDDSAPFFVGDTPLEGAEVEHAGVSMTTDSDGEVAVEGVEEGTATFEVSAEHFVTTTVDVEVDAGETVSVEVELERDNTVIVEVYDADTDELITETGTTVDISGSARAGQGGIYEFDNVWPNDTLDLEVTRDGYDTFTGDLDAPESGEKTVEVYLEEAEPVDEGDVTFEVEDADTGEPIADANVDLDGNSSSRTDADGQTTFTDVEVDTLGYTVNRSGYDDATGTVEVVVDETVTVVVQMDPDAVRGSIEVEVVDADTGDPVTEGSIDFGNITAVIGDDGTATPSDQEVGDYDLVVDIDGYDLFEETVTVEEGDNEYTAELVPDGEFTDVPFEVTDGLVGDTIEGASVEIDGQTATSDQDGTGVVEDVSVDTVPYEVTADGYEPDDGDLNITDDPPTIEFELDPTDTAAIDFTVTDGDTDESLEGATIEVDGQTFTTDADGEVRATVESDTEHDVTVSADGYDTYTGGTNTLSAGTVGPWEVSLDAEPSLEVTGVEATPGDGEITVTWDALDPHPDHDGYRVAWNPGSGSTGGGLASTLLDDTHTEWVIDDLVNGDEYTIDVRATAESDSDLDDGPDTTVTATPQAEEEQAELTVEVRDGDGDLIEGASATLDGGPFIGDGDGTFFTNLDAGTYEIEVSADGFESDSRTVEADWDDAIVEGFTLDAVEDDGPPSGTFEGTVTDSDTGDPIEGAVITDDQSGDTATTDGDGEFSVEAVVREFTVTIEADGYDQATETFEVVEDETTTLDVALDPEATEPDTGTVVGTVTDTDGDPIGGATVSIDGETTTTGEDGTFELDGVDAGTHEVVVITDGHTHGHTEVEVAAGDTTNVADVVLTAVEMALVCDAHDGAVAPGEHVGCVIAGLPAGQEGSVTVTLNPTLLDERFVADGDGNAEFAFDVPDDATGDDEVAIAVALDEAEADATVTLDIVEPDVTTVVEPDDGEQLPRTGLDLLLLVLLSAATMAAGGTALRSTSRA